jgi:hypothetical protein
MDKLTRRESIEALKRQGVHGLLRIKSERRRCESWAARLMNGSLKNRT